MRKNPLNDITENESIFLPEKIMFSSKENLSDDDLESLENHNPEYKDTDDPNDIIYLFLE